MKLYKILMGLHKSIFINFKYLKFKDAIKLPILVSNRTKFLKLNGQIIINEPIKTGMIQIGLTGSGTHSYYPTILEINGKIVFENRVRIGGGCNIVTVNNSSILKFGDNVSITGGSTIISREYIELGKNTLISWDTQIMDTDFHNIYIEDKLINDDEQIIIGEHVWIGSRCNILKGSRIGCNNIIASGSNITSNIKGENQIITGTPIKVLKKDISWKA